MKTKLEEMILWYELHRLQERYVSVIDADRLEEWPNFFTEDCVYEIIPKENADLGCRWVSCTASVVRCCVTVSLHYARPTSSSRTPTGT